MTPIPSAHFLARYLRGRSTHHQILSQKIQILVMFTHAVLVELETLASDYGKIKCKRSRHFHNRHKWKKILLAKRKIDKDICTFFKYRLN